MKLRSGKTLNGEKVQQEQKKPIVAEIPKPPTKQQVNKIIASSRPFQQPYFYKVETKKDCGHECCLWVKDKCCECMDKRPILEDKKDYKAYNNANLVDFSMVSRHYYYCGKCKDRLTSVKEIEIIELKNKFYLEETKFILACNKKNLEIAAELKKKVAELEKKLTQKKRDEAERNLWESGLETLCYHLGYCSDVMGDWWFPMYEEKGLLYLKSKLLDESKKQHKGYSCEDCNKIIMGLSD